MFQLDPDPDAYHWTPAAQRRFVAVLAQIGSVQAGLRCGADDAAFGLPAAAARGGAGLCERLARSGADRAAGAGRADGRSGAGPESLDSALPLP